MNERQFQRVGSGGGFIAALDQSGGSSAKALALYGLGQDTYSSDAHMFTLIHEMRTRIITSPAFSGDRILGAILFEDTMNGNINGQASASYLWNVKEVVPFLKIDRGLKDVADGVQLMSTITDLDALLRRATRMGMFGTKMRSVIRVADAAGIRAIVDQQFALAARIASKGLVPIIEPEVDIHCPQKAEAETLLKEAIGQRLDRRGQHEDIILKLTLPEVDNFYAELLRFPSVLRVLALSGGYSRAEANARLVRNVGLVASFSRALTEGLLVQQSDQEFDAALERSIQSIFDASVKTPPAAVNGGFTSS